MVARTFSIVLEEELVEDNEADGALISNKSQAHCENVLTKDTGEDAVSVVVIIFAHAHILLAHPFISGVLSFPSALEEELVQEEELDEPQADSAPVAEKVTGE